MDLWLNDGPRIELFADPSPTPRLQERCNRTAPGGGGRGQSSVRALREKLAGASSHGGADVELRGRLHAAESWPSPPHRRQCTGFGASGRRCLRARVQRDTVHPSPGPANRDGPGTSRREDEGGFHAEVEDIPEWDSGTRLREDIGTALEEEEGRGEGQDVGRLRRRSDGEASRWTRVPEWQPAEEIDRPLDVEDLS